MLRLFGVMFSLLSVLSLSTAQTTVPLTRYQAQLDLFAGTAARQEASTPVSEPVPAKKSVGLAVLYSLLLPGMGELYAENFSSGKYFLIAEGVLWLGYAAVEIHGNDLRDGARAFAVAHAGIDVTGKDEDFFVNIGNFMTVDEYNDKKLRDRDPDKLYDPQLGYRWTWDTEASRLTYREQRINSENMYNNRKFVGAAILINHLISAINAARAAIAFNSEQQDALGAVHLSSRLLSDAAGPHGVLVTFARPF